MAIKVSLFDGPIASCGFRSGLWTVHVDGEPKRLFLSMPACLDLNEQRERLEDAAWAAFSPVYRFNPSTGELYVYSRDQGAFLFVAHGRTRAEAIAKYEGAND